MAEPGLITGYLAELSAHLPRPIVAELADGLGQTYQHYLARGMQPDAAASAAVAEFGDPRVIVAAFTRDNPARHTARRLLAAGPVAGACWGAALVTSRAWTWPVPSPVRVLFGAALIGAITLLAVAAFGRRYRPASRAATAACLGMAALDSALLVGVPLGAPAVTWPVILAMVAGAARVLFAARSLRPLLAG